MLCSTVYNWAHMYKMLLLVASSWMHFHSSLLRRITSKCCSCYNTTIKLCNYAHSRQICKKKERKMEKEKWVENKEDERRKDLSIISQGLPLFSHKGWGPGTRLCLFGTLNEHVLHLSVTTITENWMPHGHMRQDQIAAVLQWTKHKKSSEVNFHMKQAPYFLSDSSNFGRGCVIENAW